MERLGKLSEWNDDRGFGFIAPLDGEPARVFFHIRDYRLDGRRPEVGELVKFTAQRQPDGKWRAQAVQRTVPAVRRASPATPARTASRPPSVVPGAVAVFAYALLIAWAIRAGRLPFETMFLPMILSAITYVVYALDKHAAQTGRWRTQETTLHLLELLGGWPGAWIAQQTLRHKSRKPRYRVVFWTMVVLHVAVVGTWLWTQH
ncbi:uncharacterized membrane protein YsdA (DUF1294 family)/cold shock CspA family protein [Pseudoxanthomonas japonensis]|uniref:DUF1294 domain-containing protein n=1 Tax=Pseudoxanthomonas TaxID=83618 RepID=UPI0007804EA8|nr:MULTISPECIES: DUF1294 domain-containing protein [Pseudoxanthomonas]MDR7067802.1 uncharacterized membrane protein YsdA (DUF1294 family)/cold shock CspA family protein [Pseudoxanthomonas japonensis]